MGTAVLKIYGGSQPLTGGDATTQGIIVQIGGILWNSPVSGTAGITASYAGTANGTAGTAVWARLADTSGTSVVIDGACGTAASNEFVIDLAAIAGTSIVTLTAATLIMPAS
jgi:hypothetical protein